MQPGDVLVDRFLIESPAGSGGMGSVYRARDLSSGQAVALKVLRARGALEPDRFQRESRILSELVHPGIVRYVAHGATEEGVPYLAMEWLEGEDLEMRLARAPLSIGDCLILAARVSDALAASHAVGIIHRDIKPSNLFLQSRDVEHVKLLDFGIARVTDATQTKTSADTTLGTPEYMAPEQARGAADLDARADVFSLGCVLFECLTGRAAFSGHHLMALLARVLLEEAPRVRELRPEIPPQLDALVARMLSKDPKGRPNDGATLARELASLDSLPATALLAVPAPMRLTSSEQRLLSVVVLKRREDAAVADPTAATVLVGPDPTVDACRSAIRPFGGTLERLADGTLIVTLAGTRAATDQAVLAARCALALRSIIPSAAMSLATGRGDVSLHGPVGEVIDRAARLLRRPATLDREASSEPGPVRVDEVTAGLLDARFELVGDSRGLALRGEREVVESTRTLLGREGPCLGRDRELGMLDALYEECTGEPMAHAVLVSGPAGIGKSRVRYELMQRIRSRRDATQIWLARGDPLRRASPFGLLAQALRQTAGLLDGEPIAVRRQKLRARTARNLTAAAVSSRVAEFLGELVGTPFPDDQSMQLRAARQDAMLMGDQMRRAWEEFVRAECEAGPLVLVFEDLHWGDLPTVSFVDAALRAMHDRPLLVVALGRPEVREIFPRLWSERPVTHIALDRLSKKASERLVREFLGDSVHGEAVMKVVERAAGNAFCLEELIRSVAEGRGDDFPETVLAMVQARLQGLDADHRRALRAASLFGEVFWKGGVAALLGQDEPGSRLEEILSELVDKELVARRGRGKFPGDGEFIFRHAQIREAAFQTLTAADRLLGHRLAGAWLEAAGESDPMALAEHFEQGGEPARAVSSYRRAAEQALEGNDFERALARAERGIACGAQGDVRGALLVIQAEAHRWRGEAREALERGQAAMALLEPGTVLWRTAVAEVAVATTKLGEIDQLVGVAGQLAAYPLDSPATSPAVSAHARVAMQLLAAGRRELASTLVDHAEAATAGAGADPIAIAWLRRLQAWRAHFEGNVQMHLSLMSSSAQLFEEAGDSRNGCLQRMNAGIAMSFLGDLERAESALRSAQEEASLIGLPSVSAAAKHALGSTLRRLGRIEEGRALETAAVEAFRAQGDRRMEAGSLIYLSNILRESGDLEGAERRAREALALCEPEGARRAIALGALAQTELARGATQEALATAEAAMKLLRSQGGVEEGEAAVRLVHAEALHATGRHADAKAAIAEARDLLHARANRIDDPSLRATFVNRVAENARTLALAAEWSQGG